MPKTPLADYSYVLQEHMADLNLPTSVMPEPGAAIAQAAQVVKNYSLSDVKQLCATMAKDPIKAWPTPGQWVHELQAQYRARQAGNVTGKGVASPDGFTLDKIMQSRQGLAAKRAGKPHTFLMDVQSGKIPVSTLDFPSKNR